jgi:hypothetical protein
MAVYSPSGFANVHIDEVLTNISLGYPNNGLVGDRLFPSVPVAKQSNKYPVFGREGWLDTYFANEHSLQIAVTDEERENADSPLRPDADGTEMVTSKVLIGRELVIKNLVTTASNYASGLSTTLSGTSQWSDYVNSNPIADIKTARRALNAQIFMDPNTAVIPYQVMSILEDHPDFIERIKYSERAIITPEIISAMFGIPNIIVPGSGINTANPGQAASLGYLWGKDVVLAWVPPRAGQKIPAFGYEFVWGYGGGRAQVVDRWREEKRKCDVIRVSRRYDLKFIAVDGSGKALAGYIIKNAVA